MGEMKLALQRWRTPQAEVDACIEKADLVALYKRQRELSEARRAQAERARQQQQSQRSAASQNYYHASAGGGGASKSGLPALSWSTWALLGLGLVFLLQRLGVIGDGMGPGLGGEHVEDVAFDLADDATPGVRSLRCARTQSSKPHWRS